MTITVQCAGNDVPEDGAMMRTSGDDAAAVQEAVLEAQRTGAPVYLDLR